MQLSRISFAACALLAASLHADDYVSVQYLHYDEADGRITVSAPSFEINIDFGVDDTLNFTGTYDAISGASPTYYDASSSASGIAEKPASPGAARPRKAPISYDLGRGPVSRENVAFGNIDISERRNALGALYTHRFGSRDELRLGLNWSLEYDLYLYEGSAEYMHYLDPSKNRAVTFGASYQYHANLVPCGPYSSGCDASSGSSKQIASHHYNLQAAYSQVLSPRSFAKASVFYLPETGYLTNSYKNVVRHYDTAPVIVNERRPDTRHAGGVMLEYFDALTPEASLHLGYRYYLDDWKVRSHTPYIKLFDRILPKLRIEAGYRYYVQSAAAYFYSGSRDTFTDERYASSDERLSAFNAYETTLGATYWLRRDLRLNFSYSHYEQSTRLRAHYIVTGFRYDF